MLPFPECVDDGGELAFGATVIRLVCCRPAAYCCNKLFDPILSLGQDCSKILTAKVSCDNEWLICLVVRVCSYRLPLKLLFKLVKFLLHCLRPFQFEVSPLGIHLCSEHAEVFEEAAIVIPKS